MSVCDAAPRGPQTSHGIWCFPGQMPHNQCTGAPGPCLQLRPLTGLSLTVTTTVRISALHNIRVSALHNIRVAPRYGRCWVLQGNLIHLPRRQVSSGKFRAALILKMADVTYRPFTVGSLWRSNVRDVYLQPCSMERSGKRGCARGDAESDAGRNLSERSLHGL